jgi:hypothetical protein
MDHTRLEMSLLDGGKAYIRFNFQVRALLFPQSNIISPKNGDPEQKTHAAITFLSQLPEGLFPDTSH